MARSKDPTSGGESSRSEIESGETVSLTQRSPSIAARVRRRSALAVCRTFVDGDVVAERYRIVRFIAQGGMGEVYEAEDLTLGGRVALKTVRGELASETQAMERFKREIHLARKVTHPNICRLYDIGAHPLPEIGEEVTFLTMEMLAGRTLDQHVAAAGRLRPKEALPIVEQIAAGLDAAHAVDVVHRDFKSSNVVLAPTAASGREVRAVITDFGLARGTTKDPDLATISASGEVLGTPAYMAPEQVEGREATPAADIYAFGIVLYEMVTGRRPFDGGSAFSVAARRLAEPPEPPRSLVPDLDPVWEAVILHCLERDPQRRFASALEIPKALTGTLVLPDAPTTRTPHAVSPPTPPTAAAPATRAPQRRATYAVLGVVLLAAVVIGSILLRRDLPTAPWAGPTAPDAAQVTPRRSLAVLGFDNVTGRSDAAWLSTAVAEMLTTELAAGQSLRTVDGRRVAQARQDLGITTPGDLDTRRSGASAGISERISSSTAPTASSAAARALSCASSCGSATRRRERSWTVGGPRGRTGSSSTWSTGPAMPSGVISVRRSFPRPRPSRCRRRCRPTLGPRASMPRAWSGSGASTPWRPASSWSRRSRRTPSIPYPTPNWRRSIRTWAMTPRPWRRPAERRSWRTPCRKTKVERSKRVIR